MASVSDSPTAYVQERPQWAEFLKIREMWASLSIMVMWLAVLFDAVYGPNFVHSTSAGNSTTIPSAVLVAFFTFLATVPLAKYGFHEQKK